ncbi:8212_t:CDS:2, partial [Funneliformis geosporum]
FKMNQFGRCRIGSEILVQQCQVQYYFTHMVNLPYELTENLLAYVCWYQPASSPNV